MSEGDCSHPLCHLHHLFCNEGAGDGCAQHVSLVAAVGFNQWKDVLLHELPFGIHSVVLVCDCSGFLFSLGYIWLPNIHHDRNHMVIAISLLQQRDAY